MTTDGCSDDEFDLNTIDRVHEPAKLQAQLEEDKKRQAFGVSHNLFDVSSYAEVRFNQVLRDSA